jgi:hypothetical protein
LGVARDDAAVDRPFCAGAAKRSSSCVFFTDFNALGMYLRVVLARRSARIIDSDYDMDADIYVTKAGQFHRPDQDLLPL